MRQLLLLQGDFYLLCTHSSVARGPAFPLWKRRHIDSHIFFFYCCYYCYIFFFLLFLLHLQKAAAGFLSFSFFLYIKRSIPTSAFTPQSPLSLSLLSTPQVFLTSSGFFVVSFKKKVVVISADTPAHMQACTRAETRALRSPIKRKHDCIRTV